MSSHYVSVFIDHPGIKQFIKPGEPINAAAAWRWLIVELAGKFLAQNSIDVLRNLTISAELKQNGLSFSFETDSNVGYADLNALVQSFDQIGIEQYRVSMFDSASGGKELWVKPEEDISLYESKVLLLGEFDEEDEIEPTIEDQGGEVVATLNDCTLIVLSDSATKEELKRAQAGNVPMIQESEFWDYVE
jgi:NAD-dependent DNA ligase